MYWNFVIHQIFPEFLQPLRDLRTQRVALFPLGFLFIGFWIFIGLVIIRSPRSVIIRSWHVHWRDVTLSSILSFSSLGFTYCRWWRRAWRRCWAMTPLSWKCPWSWWIRSWKRIWQARNLNRNPVLNEMWFLTIDPFIRISVFIAKLSERQHCWCVFEDFHSQEYVRFFDIHCCLFMRLHFSIGGYDYRRTARFRQSIHFSITLKSFLLIICIDAPESTSRHQFSESEKNVALSCSFIFNTFLANFHAASRAHRSCHSVSSWDRSSNFGALGLRWWGSPGQIYPSEGFWSRILVWGAIAFVNFTHWIGFCMSELFRKIDSGGFMSWKTQPNCRAFDDRRPIGPCFHSWQVSRLTSGLPGLSWHLSRLTTGCHTISCKSFSFNIVTALLSFFFEPFTRLFINLTICIRALFLQSASTLGLVEEASWEMPFFTEWIGASSFKVILAGPSRHSTTGTFSSGTSGSRRSSLILLHERIRRRIRLCHFCTLIDIVAETAIVSSRTMSVGFPLPTISKNSLYTLFCSLDSWPRRSSQNFRFWRQNSYFVYLARYFFLPSSSIRDNQVQLSSDESPGHTIPRRSWVSQTLVFLICTILPRHHQVGFLSLTIKFRPTLYRIPEYHHFEQHL